MLHYHNNNSSKFGKANGRAFERSIEVRNLLVSALTNISSTNLNFHKLKFKNVNHINNIARITYNNSIVYIKDFVEHLHSFFAYIAFADFDSDDIIEHGDELVLLFRGLIYINSISEQRNFIDKINKNLNDYDYFKQHFDYLIIDKNKDIGFINDYDFKAAMHYNQQNSHSNTYVFNDMIYHGINQLAKAVTDYVVNFTEFDVVII